MPSSASYLSSELHYIIPLAEEHGSEARVANYDQKLGRHVEYAETLSSDQIEVLAELYIAINARNHGQLINEWHQKVWGKCPAETSWPIYGLLLLFAQLGRLDIAPFNDGEIRPHR